MEIAELVKNAPELDLGNEMQQIFERQNKINYITTLYNKDILKPITQEVMEHLAKCYQLYLGISRLKEKAEGFSDTEMLKYGYKFNYEFSIALSKMVDLVRAAGINEYDILNYYDTLLTQLKLKDAYFFEDNILQTCLQYARHNNIGDQIYNNPMLSLRPIKYKFEGSENFLKAGRILNPLYANLFAENCWATSYNLLLSSSNIPENIESDFERYQNQIMESWLHFFKLADLLGHDWDSIGRIYSVYYYSQTQK